MKPLLSIIIPVAPNRGQRLAAVLSRLNLNAAVFPDHRFEVIVADGGATDNTREICETMAKYMPLKYIYLPIGRFINAAYPRNVMLRVCEGDVISMLDIDHWPGENVVYGMLNPFVDDTDFRVVLGGVESRVSDNLEYLGVHHGLTNNIINRGYVIDSSKSAYCSSMEDPRADEINRPLLNPTNFEKKILDVYNFYKIPPPGVNGTLWIWSVKREHVIRMNGYDEMYCRQFAYVREDDDWRERLLAQGLRFWDGQNRNFCAIHLWHKAGQRNQEVNRLNRERFDKTCCPVKNVERNIDWAWGKLLRDSFSIINGMIRDSYSHEEWVKDNIPDMPNYYSNMPYHDWASLDEFMRNLELYATK